VTEDALTAYDRWREKWSDDLEDVEIEDRPRVYSYMLTGIDIDLAKTMVAVETK
jgi:predicted nuclease of predicted toxin-antitoxin system